MEDLPVQSAKASCTDFRVDNVPVDGEGDTTAGIAGEMSAVGDPLTDLALVLTHDQVAGTVGDIVVDASLAPGYLDEDEVLARYTTLSERDLLRIGWYRGLATFTLVGIWRASGTATLPVRLWAAAQTGWARPSLLNLDAALAALDD